MRKEGKLIGHRVKSINNPDKRVEILNNFALDRSQFQQETKLLDYAIEVEKVTTTKKPNIILNVDGAIGVIWGHYEGFRMLYCVSLYLYRHSWDDITYLMPEYGLGETA